MKRYQSGQIHDTFQLYIFESCLDILLDKFRVILEVRDLNTKIVFVVCYLCWTMPYWYLTIPLLTILTLASNPTCQRAQTQISSLIEIMLVHSKRPHIVLWSTEVYISSTLLLLLNEDPKMYLLIGIATFLPHLIDEIKKQCLRDTSDEVGLQIIRTIFVFANKALLLYICWGMWKAMRDGILLFLLVSCHTMKLHSSIPLSIHSRYVGISTSCRVVVFQKLCFLRCCHWFRCGVSTL